MMAGIIEKQQIAGDTAGPGPGPLSDEHWRMVEALQRAVSAAEAKFISEHFAALAGSRHQVAQPEIRTMPLTVLFATETGNSEFVAKAVAKEAETRSLQPTIYDLADYDVAKLADEALILAIVSTTGEGDAPYAASSFFEDLVQADELDLSEVRFSVLALGDSTYADFCETGKVLDRELERLGATRLSPRVDCDLDFEDSARAWSTAVLNTIAEQAASNAAAAPSTSSVKAVGLGRHQVFQSEILDSFLLTKASSTKETRHLSLRLPADAPTYAPGDAVGIVVRNDPVVVEDLLSVLGLSATSQVSIKGNMIDLQTAIERHFEVTAATPRFLDHWAGLSGSEQLRDLSEDDRKSDRFEFLHNHHIADIVRQYPVSAVDPQEFVASLRPLQPRLYSIASSLKRHPGEIHITLGQVRYTLHGTERMGVASALLSKVEAGGTLDAFIQANEHFRLPKADVPIIMIGAGTGVAPYRSFLQELEAEGRRSPSWLFFGERHSATDFLYEHDWQRFLESGLLTQLDSAFSRDGASKYYVNHRMIERAEEFFRWLQDGAHIFVCGDAATLGPSVHAAILEIVCQAGDMPMDQAEEYLRGLQDNHRYHRDVY